MRCRARICWLSTRRYPRARHLKPIVIVLSQQRLFTRDVFPSTISVNTPFWLSTSCRLDVCETADVCGPPFVLTIQIPSSAKGVTTFHKGKPTTTLIPEPHKPPLRSAIYLLSKPMLPPTHTLHPARNDDPLTGVVPSKPREERPQGGIPLYRDA